MAPNTKTSSTDRSNWPIIVAATCTVAAGATYAVFLWRSHPRRRSRSNNDDNDPPPQTSSGAPDSTLNGASTKNTSFLSLLPSHLQYQLQKEERRRAKLPWLTRKTPLYDNIHMLDPTGHLLCNVSHKKANWYIRKGLATWTNEKKHDAIQLLFTPQGGNKNISNADTQEEGDTTDGSTAVQTDASSSTKRLYTTSVKQNICVVCGASDNLIRHYVVPLSYRKLFPYQFKSHQPHDIVLLCADCHMTSDHLYQERMQELDQQHRPADEHERHTAMSHFIDAHLTKVQSSALALLRYRDRMPRERIIEYEAFLCQHLQDQPEHLQPRQQQPDHQGATETILTTHQLEFLSHIDVKVVNDNYIPGANLVVEAMTDDDEQITNFVLDWRKFFVDELQPHHLPIGWSIDSPVISDTRVKPKHASDNSGAATTVT